MNNNNQKITGIVDAQNQRTHGAKEWKCWHAFSNEIMGWYAKNDEKFG